MQSNVVIIEDEPEMAEYIKDVIQDHGFLGFTSNSGAEGMNLIRKVQPELVLLDLMLPDIDGRSICKKIKQDFPNIKVIMITGQDSSDDVAKGLEYGADDYLAKPIDTTVLMARIKARLRNTNLQKKTLECGDLTLDQETHEVRRGGKVINLTPQEYRLLNYLMVNKNMVLSREMILSRIWQGNPDIETRVVDVYIGYLRSKIDFKKPKLIKTVRGFGYTLKNV